MRAGTRGGIAAASVAVLTVASLGVLAWQRLSGTPVAPGATATLGGITTEVREAGWVPLDHVHDGEGGFLMPDEMMPGAPTGEQVRLGVTLTLSNTDSGTHRFSIAEEFAVTGGVVTEPQPVRADNIGVLPRLAPGAAVDGTIYFDIEVPGEDDPPLYLQWTRDGDTTRIAVPLDEDAPEHEHG